MNARTLLPFLWDRDEASTAGFGSLRKEIDKVFDEFSRSFRAPDVLSGAGRLGLMPDMDVHNTDKDVRLAVELPGVEEKDIEITASGREITISGEKKLETETKTGEIYRSERSYGSFNRAISMPFDIDADKVEAKFDKGVLTIVVAKPAGVVGQTKKIAISA